MRKRGRRMGQNVIDEEMDADEFMTMVTKKEPVKKERVEDDAPDHWQSEQDELVMAKDLEDLEATAKFGVWGSSVFESQEMYPWEPEADYTWDKDADGHIVMKTRFRKDHGTWREDE